MIQLPNDLQASLNLICMIANDTLIEVFARLPQDISSFTITRGLFVTNIDNRHFLYI